MSFVLVTGGAGYIGSHTVHELLKEGFMPVVADNLSTGFRESLPPDIPFYQVDARDESALGDIFDRYEFAAVVHLAGFASVAESVLKPLEYLDNNIRSLECVLAFCGKFNVKRLIFSSSSTIYGDANKQELLAESHRLSPLSPYGDSKLTCEKRIREFAEGKDFSYLSLRYFNVAGANSSLTNGQRGERAYHILHQAAKAAVTGTALVVNGVDYATVDGTCVRDYIHVEDIALVHVSALKHLLKTQVRAELNCGYGQGYSVLQIVNHFKKINQVDFPVVFGPRRVGDPEYLVGDSSKLVQLLNWRSKFHSPLEEICRSAYLWEKQLSLLKA